MTNGVSGQDKPQAAPSQGVLPKGSDGKPLNLDFEAGDLRDWTAAGDAFTGQPIKGDTVFARRNDMKSEHVGQFWIGTYERNGDPPQGTLTSVPFVVTQRYAGFLIGGGPTDATRIELSFLARTAFPALSSMVICSEAWRISMGKDCHPG